MYARWPVPLNWSREARVGHVQPSEITIYRPIHLSVSGNSQDSSLLTG